MRRVFVRQRFSAILTAAPKANVTNDVRKMLKKVLLSKSCELLVKVSL